MTPQRFKSPTRELWWETEARRFDIPFRGTRLAAWKWGSQGPTVLLIHGWGGRGLQMGAFAEPLVEAGYQVLAVDLPAHGRSPGKQSSLPEAADAVAAIFAFVAEHSPGGLAAVIAHSFGSVATTLALARGAEQPERLVFIGAPSDLDTVLSRFSELSGFSQEVLDRLRRDLENRFDFRWKALHPHLLADSIRLPLLVIHDRQDDETSWREGRRLAEAWPGARFLTTDGLGHFRILRDETVVRQALAFIEHGGDLRSVA